MSDAAGTEGDQPDAVPWRVGRLHAVHVYAGDVAVATFTGATEQAEANARRAVAAVNAAAILLRVQGHLSGLRAASSATAHRYEGLANVFRATAGGNAETLTDVYDQTARLLVRLVAGLDEVLAQLSPDSPADPD